MSEWKDFHSEFDIKHYKVSERFDVLGTCWCIWQACEIGDRSIYGPPRCRSRWQLGSLLRTCKQRKGASQWPVVTQMRIEGGSLRFWEGSIFGPVILALCLKTSAGTPQGSGLPVVCRWEETLRRFRERSRGFLMCLYVVQCYKVGRYDTL